MKQKLVVLATIYFGSAVMAMTLLWISLTIPGNAIGGNVGKTLTVFESEGTYPSRGLSFRKIVLDNFTDSIMVNTAYSVKDNSLQSMLLAERQILSNAEVDQIKNLKAAVEGSAPVRSSYERYWHGYLIFLRPLLAITSYQGIRIVLHITLFGLFGLLLRKIIKRRGVVRGLALLVGAIAVDFFWIGQSIQFSSVFLIGLLMGVTLIKHEEWAIYVFFVTGMATAFFDLLTAPLVGLGFLLICDKDEPIFRRLARNLITWLAGYGLFWSGKWFITDATLGNGTILNSLGHVTNRTITQPDPNFSYFKTILLNLAQLIGYADTSRLLVGGFCLVLILVWIKFHKQKIDQKKLMYWVIVGLLPYGWYLIAANHSYLHVWYTYRDQMITVAAGMMAYRELIDGAKIGKLFGKIGSESRRN